MPNQSRLIGWISASLLCLPTLLVAQEPKSPPVKEQYQALLKEFEDAEAVWDKQRDPKHTPADPAWTEHLKTWPMWTFAPRFVQFAEAHPGEPEAVDALLKLVDFSETGHGRDRQIFPYEARALRILSRDHLDDPKVIEKCTRASIYGGPHLEAYFRVLLAKGRDRDSRARACLALVGCIGMRLSMAARPFFDHPEDMPKYREASLYMNSRIDPEYITYVRQTDEPALSAEKVKLMERLIDEFGDVPYYAPWSKGKGQPDTMASRVGTRLEALRNLSAGKPAPEIAGQDIDGKPMKLSDYRGKVVMLSFWGTWCGPCMRFVPYEKELAKRLEGKPFVILGINSDRDREKVKGKITEEGITWRSWWDGGKAGGPIATRWDVYAWPTVILIDQQGVIRYPHLKYTRTKELDQAVDTLLKEIKP